VEILTRCGRLLHCWGKQRSANGRRRYGWEHTGRPGLEKVDPGSDFTNITLTPHQKSAKTGLNPCLTPGVPGGEAKERNGSGHQGTVRGNGRKAGVEVLSQVKAKVGLRALLA